MQPSNDLYFVFIGDRLPKYVVPSIKLALRHSGMRVNLIANQAAVSRQLRDLIRIHPIESFYDPTVFNNVVQNVNADHSFRDSFWLKTLERFFVLSQFSSRYGTQSFFHAELDQLLFKTDDLVGNIEKTGRKGLFFPFHNPEKAIASVFYCNDILALDPLLEFANKESGFANEMQLLAGWAQASCQMVHPLPTMISAAKKDTTTNLLEADRLSILEVGGVVDAAQLGQWVGGQDPRNISIHQSPSTKFIDPPNQHLLGRRELENTKFTLTSMGPLVAELMDGTHVRVYNLHLHSKVHGYLLRRQSRLGWLLMHARGDRSIQIPGTRSAQIRYYFVASFSSLLRRLFATLHALAKRGAS